MTSYLTIDGEFEFVQVIEHSKFICHVKGINDESEAKEYVQKIKKEHSLATHNCYAYIADDKGLIQKFSDDGEPQGTAGLPILEALKAKKIHKTVIVVTRYFGGVKLGKGGLVRAYNSSAVLCLESSKIVRYLPTKFYKIVCDYENYSKILSLTAKDGYAITNTEFGDSITIDIAVFLDNDSTFLTEIADIFKGKSVCTLINEGSYKF